MPPKPSKPEPPLNDNPFIKKITVGRIGIEVYGGPVFDVDVPGKNLSGGDSVNSVDVIFDVTDLAKEEGRKGMRHAEALVEHIKEAFREAGYKAVTNFPSEDNVLKDLVSEDGKVAHYLSARYPVKMNREDLFEHAIELVNAGIDSFEKSKTAKATKPKTVAASAPVLAMEYYDRFVSVLTTELGATGASDFQREYPKLLNKLAAAAAQPAAKKTMDRT